MTTENFRFEGIGTQWMVSTGRPLDERIRRDILAAVENFDRLYSRFRDDSLVTRIAAAQNGGSFTVPAEDTALFDWYDELFDRTGGAVDPLVGRDLERLGYDAQYSLTPRAASDSSSRLRWPDAVRRRGADITTDTSVLIDIGAAGKGFLVDRLFRMLVAEGHEQVVVDGSGDLRCASASPLRVGLEHPDHPDRALGVVELTNGALCASAINRRAWGPGLHHVIDGRSGLPTSGVRATWVTAPDAVTADGVATALFFVGPDALHGIDCEWVRMTEGGALEASAGFAGELFA